MKATFLAAVLALGLLSGPVYAAANPSAVALTGSVQLEKTVTVDGTSRIELVEPKVVVPGDRLLFTTSYRNDSAAAVTDFVVTNPVPGAVVVSPDALNSVEVSVDGGKTWGLIAALKVADGKGGLRAALAADATHLRWTIPSIAPGASGKVEYHAIVR
ncbi:hypothetical protein [Novosphingobium sp. Chol11]|uniref:hypothetical protein n=1 Tax=Novosphingobium sp. Chol11 TaxID=1385763 RepID=UPI0025D2E41A|nr:hypothetical protein [Novosphingobium sp. Chol11]